MAKSWVGRGIDDADGGELGTCTSVYADDSTGATEWLVVVLPDDARVLVPIVDAVEHDGRVRVSFARDRILSAPRVGTSGHVAVEEEARLYEHYGVEYSSRASDTLLPSSETTDSAGTDTAPPLTPAVVPPSAPLTEAVEPVEPVEPGEPPTLAPTPVPPAREWAPPTRVEPPRSSKPWLPVVLGGAAVGATAVATRQVQVRRRRSRTPAPADAARQALLRASAAAAPLAAASSSLGRQVQRGAQRAGAQTERAGKVAGRSARSGLEAGRRGVPALGDAAWTAVRGVLYVPALGTVLAQKSAEPAKATAVRVAAEAQQARRQASRKASKVAKQARRSAGAGAAKVSGKAAKASGRAAKAGGSTAGAVGAAGKQVTATVTGIRKTGKSAMSKLTTALGFGMGYVLGARAGRERYEQIREQATKLSQRPEVQQVTDKLRGASSSDGPSLEAASTPSSGPYAGRSYGTETAVVTETAIVEPLGTPASLDIGTSASSSPDVDLTLGQETPTWQSDRT